VTIGPYFDFMKRVRTDGCSVSNRRRVIVFMAWSVCGRVDFGVKIMRTLPYLVCVV